VFRVFNKNVYFLVVVGGLIGFEGVIGLKNDQGKLRVVLYHPFGCGPLDRLAYIRCVFRTLSWNYI